MKLYPDTNLIPWPNFLISSMKRRRDLGAMFLLSIVAVVAVALTVVYPAMGSLTVIALFTGVGVVSMGFAVLADRMLTRPVVVYRKDSAGQAFEDHQKWWAEDALKWPDIYKLAFNKKRVLWIDALDEKNLLPFMPWIAPQPTSSADGTLPVTGSRVASVVATSKAVAQIMKYKEPSPGEKVQQGLIAVIIIGSFIAMLMAGTTAIDMMGLTP